MDKKSEILQELIGGLDSKQFNLEAWKVKAISILKMLLLDDEERISKIEHLQYEYSSWNLRDNSGGKTVDSVKLTAKEIIESAKIKLQLNDNDPVLNVFQDELSGKQIHQIEKLVKEETADNIGMVTDFFDKLEASKKSELLAALALVAFK